MKKVLIVLSFHILTVETKEGDIVFNAQEFVSFLNQNGGQVHDLRFEQANRLLSRVLLLEFAFA